jgi:hypothetical protein
MKLYNALQHCDMTMIGFAQSAYFTLVLEALSLSQLGLYNHIWGIGVQQKEVSRNTRLNQ